MTGLFDRYRCAIDERWIDYNGHLNEAYYLVPFSLASDCWMDDVGLDQAGRDAHKATLYTVEAHILYLREVRAPATLRVATQFLGCDPKRVYTLSRMYREGDTKDAGPLATHEALYLCVETVTGRAGTWPAPVLEKLSAWCDRHKDLPWPLEASRHLGPEKLRRRTPG